MHSGREPEHPVGDRSQGKPWFGLSAASRELAQCRRRSLRLVDEGDLSVSKLRRRERIVGRSERTSRSVECSLPLSAERFEVERLIVRRGLGSLTASDASALGRTCCRGAAAADACPTRGRGSRHRPSSRSVPASSFKPLAEPARVSAAPAPPACSSSPTRCRTKR